MDDVYVELAQMYDKFGISDFSVSFGDSMLKYFDCMYPNETFKKNLDICCGTGTLCGFFKDNGIQTKGVDLSAEMLDVARSKYCDVEFIKCNASEFNDGEVYDFITCTYDALNHITDIEDVKRIVKNANVLLRDGGLFIFDINNFDILTPGEYNKDSFNGYSKLSLVQSRDGDLIKTDVKYYEHDKLIWQKSLFERDYSISKLTQIFNREGFVLDSCSQHFLDEKRSEKWKLIFKKVE